MDINAFPTSYLLMSIGIMILLSAYFSGTETAMMALNRYRLRHLVRRGNRGARKSRFDAATAGPAAWRDPCRQQLGEFLSCDSGNRHWLSADG